MPELDGGVKYEHLHRYLFCRSYVKGRVVLDIASGEGYGSRWLAEEANRVYGVDIDEEAVSHASKKYTKSNLSFHLGSCEAIPLEDASIDIAVSFETIEHHDKHEEMMLEIKRVLKPDGILIISSPNKFVHQDKNKNANPFHIKELYEDEFKRLMAAHFKHCYFLDQKLISGSAITLRGGGKGHTIVCSKEGEFQLSQDIIPSVVDPYYFLAVCSDIDVPKERLTASIYLEEKDNLLFDFISALLDANKIAHEKGISLEERNNAFENQLGAYEKALKEFSEVNEKLSNVTNELTTAKLRLARIDSMLVVRVLRYIKKIISK